MTVKSRPPVRWRVFLSLVVATTLIAAISTLCAQEEPTEKIWTLENGVQVFGVWNPDADVELASISLVADGETTRYSLENFAESERKYVENERKKRGDDAKLPATAPESMKTNEKYALPTEAQWEYACRAGSETRFFWGDKEEDGEGYLNGADESGKPNGEKWSSYFPFNDGYQCTAPVGSFKPNAWGLYDMSGNVWEWCADWYDSAYYKNSPEQDPTGPDEDDSGSDRVYRGGSWDCYAELCRSADRSSSDPSYRNYYLGLRLALVRL